MRCPISVLSVRPVTLTKVLGFGRDVRVSIPTRGNDGIVSLRHLVQTGTGAHLASYSMGTVGSYTRGKSAGV
jgi:hypothetical protein